MVDINSLINIVNEIKEKTQKLEIYNLAPKVM